MTSPSSWFGLPFPPKPGNDVCEFLVEGGGGGGLGTRNALSVLALIDRNLSRDARAPEGFRV